MEDKVNYNIIKYLKNLANKKNDASLQTGVQYLQTALNLWVSDENDKLYPMKDDLYKLIENSIASTSSQKSSESSAVDSKFEEYKKILQSKNYFAGTTEGSKEYNDRLQKAKEKFYEKYKSESNTNESPEDRKMRAEQLKNQGNEKFKKGDFNGAIQSYTDAINV